jgi:hypothetical protein
MSKYYLIVIPYGDNDYWSYMYQVGKILYSIYNEDYKIELPEKDLSIVVKDTMKYVFSLHKPKHRATELTEYLTKDSLWGNFMGTNFNIYTDDKAYDYLENIKFDGNREVLVIDFNDKDNPVYNL